MHFSVNEQRCINIEYFTHFEDTEKLRVLSLEKESHIDPPWSIVYNNTMYRNETNHLYAYDQLHTSNWFIACSDKTDFEVWLQML